MNLSGDCDRIRILCIIFAIHPHKMRRFYPQGPDVVVYGHLYTNKKTLWFSNKMDYLANKASLYRISKEYEKFLKPSAEASALS